MSNPDLRKSLEFLKDYIARAVSTHFDTAGLDYEHYNILMDHINHAIDHVIVDHCPEEHPVSGAV